LDFILTHFPPQQFSPWPRPIMLCYNETRNQDRVFGLWPLFL
jgi:hypothetical protein